MRRILVLALMVAFIPQSLWASYGKSNVLQKEIHRTPLASEPLPATGPGTPPSAPAATAKGCTKNIFYPFTIHVLSSQSLSDAKRSMDRLNGGLGTVFITKTDLGVQGIWYRVDYGMFITAKDAVIKMRELQSKGAIDKGAFLGGPTPYTLELAAYDAKAKDTAKQEIERLQKLGVTSYALPEGSDCVRVVSGAFPDMKSAKMVQAEMLKLGLNPTITKR